MTIPNLNQRMMTEYSQVKLKEALHTDALNFFSDVEGSGASLILDLRATSSGLLTNRRVYPGVKMRRSSSTWVSRENGGSSDYDRPILTNHDTDRDPIGRVRKQKYFQLLKGDAFKLDFQNPARTSADVDRISGFIKLRAELLDRNAIEMALDGRFDTVSQSMHPDSAFCSICGQDFMQDFCGHYPGDVYVDPVVNGEVRKGKYLAYLITGLMDYKEISFVNIPAQGNARIEEVVSTPDSAIDFDRLEVILDSVWGDSEHGIPSLENRGVALMESYKLCDKHNQNGVELIGVSELPKTSIITGKASVSMAITDKNLTVSSSILPSWTELSEDTNEQTGTSSTTDTWFVSVSEDTKVHEDISNGTGSLESPTGSDSSPESRSGATEGLTDAGDSPVNVESPQAIENDGELQMSDDKKKTTVSDATEVSGLGLEDTQLLLKEKLVEVSGLKDELSGRDATINEKAELLKKTTDELTSSRDAYKKEVARNLVFMRAVLQKPDMEGVEDSEAFDDRVDALSERTVESLNDSVADLLPEFLDSVKRLGSIGNAFEDKTKVIDPTLTDAVETKKPKVPSKDKNSTANI